MSHLVDALLDPEVGRVVVFVVLILIGGYASYRSAELAGERHRLWHKTASAAFRARVTASGLTLAEIACRTGIKQSKLERFMSGRNVPWDDELLTFAWPIAR
jgi:hypothetical protein